jgi:hypothetical protein
MVSTKNHTIAAANPAINTDRTSIGTAKGKTLSFK